MKSFSLCIPNYIVIIMTIELVKIEDVSSIKKRREEKMTKQEKGFLKRLKNR